MLRRCDVSLSAGNSAPAVGSRKRRRKAATSTSGGGEDTSGLEPGVEWYEDETCESADCKRPKKKRTSWVGGQAFFYG